MHNNTQAGHSSRFQSAKGIVEQIKHTILDTDIMASKFREFGKRFDEAWNTGGNIYDFHGDQENYENNNNNDENISNLCQGASEPKNTQTGFNLMEDHHILLSGWDYYVGFQPLRVIQGSSIDEEMANERIVKPKQQAKQSSGNKEYKDWDAEDFFLTGFAGVKTPDTNLGLENTQEKMINPEGKDAASRIRYDDFIHIKFNSQGNFEGENDEGFLSSGNYNHAQSKYDEYKKPSSSIKNEPQKGYEEENDEGFLSGGHRNHGKSHL